MNRVYYYIYKLLKFLHLAKGEFKEYKVRIKSRNIQHPSIKQLNSFDSVTFKKLKLSKMDVERWVNISDQQFEELKSSHELAPVHTVVFWNINFKADTSGYGEWAEKFNYILDFKRYLSFYKVPFVYVSPVKDGILKVAVLCKPDKHYDKALYYKWLGQILFVLGIIHFMYKPKVIVMSHNGDNVSVWKGHIDLYEKATTLSATLMDIYGIANYKETFMKKIKFFNTVSSRFRRYIFTSKDQDG